MWKALLFSLALVLSSAPAVSAQCLDPAVDVNASGSTDALDVQCIILAAKADFYGDPTPGCLAGSMDDADIDCTDAIDVTDVKLAILAALGSPYAWPVSIDADGDFCAEACLVPDTDPLWIPNGDFLMLAKDDGTYFAGSDCNGNFFGADTATVGGVPFQVGPHIFGSNMAGLVPGGTTIPAPFGDSAVETAYLIFPGGRCSSQTLSVRFDYTDSSSSANLSVSIPHDCANGGTFGGANVAITHQGTYGGPCCDNWYQGAFSNPDPANAVASITVTYNDGCGGSYNGQMWALSVD